MFLSLQFYKIQTWKIQIIWIKTMLIVVKITIWKKMLRKLKIEHFNDIFFSKIGSFFLMWRDRQNISSYSWSAWSI